MQKTCSLYRNDALNYQTAAAAVFLHFCSTSQFFQSSGKIGWLNKNGEKQQQQFDNLMHHFNTSCMSFA